MLFSTGSRESRLVLLGFLLIERTADPKLKLRMVSPPYGWLINPPYGWLINIPGNRQRTDNNPLVGVSLIIWQ